MRSLRKSETMRRDVTDEGRALSRSSAGLLLVVMWEYQQAMHRAGCRGGSLVTEVESYCWTFYLGSLLSISLSDIESAGGSVGDSFMTP